MKQGVDSDAVPGSSKRFFASVRGTVVALLTVVFPLLIIYNGLFHPWLVWPTRAFFMGWILSLAIILNPLKYEGAVRGKINMVIDFILVAAILVCCLHIMLDWEYITLMLGAPRPIDIGLGIAITLITLEATRRTMFPLVPVCIALLLYAAFGHYLAGLMAAPPLSVARIVQQLYLETTGLYGLVLNVALKYIILFLIMGALLKAMGAMDVLGDLVNLLVGRTVGGPAKIAVVTSSMFGMMSGSSVANVAFTGTFTIPIMKRYGYKSEFAAGVEATASCGGHLMPPIMGTAAFVMADFTGIPYIRIMVAAILPALLYYLAIFARVHYKAKHEGLQKPTEDIVGKVKSLRQILPRLIPIVATLTILVWGLFMFTPTKAVIIAIGAIIPLSFLRPETRLTPRKIIDALRDSTNSFKPIGAAFIAFGILMAVATQTGLGLKFSELMLIASAHNLVILLLVTAIACIIMGMGIGGTAVYIFAGLMLAPALIDLGVPLLPAHFFIFYFAQLQSITPPVCVTSYTAASIACANPVKTAINAVIIGIVGFFLGFLFVLHPELLLEGSIASSLITFSFMAIGVLALVFMFEGYANRAVSIWERILFGLSALLIFAQWNYIVSLVGVVIVGILIFVPITIKRRSQGSQNITQKD